MSTCKCCPRRLVSTAVAIVGDTLQITIPTTSLSYKTKLCLILAQPVPESADNLPVVILNDGATISVERAPFGNLEYGEDLTACDRTRRRIPLYYNNAGRFSDLTGLEKFCRCREV